MKFLIPISVLLMIGCSTSKRILVESKNREVLFLNKNYNLHSGSCYGKGKIDYEQSQTTSDPNCHKTGFFLSEEKVKFKKRKIKISIEEIENNKLPNGKIRIVTQPQYYDVSIKTEGTEPYFSGSTYPNVYLFCIESIPEKSVEFTYEEIVANDFLIEKSEIIQTPKIFIKEPKKIPTKIKPGEIYCKAGCWTELRQALHPIVLRPPSLKEAKKKLIEFGNYDLLINNQLDASTKKALRDFQSKKGLEVTGLLTFETLKALGYP